jgi:hypothetical protein
LQQDAQFWTRRYMRPEWANLRHAVTGAPALKQAKLKNTVPATP